MLERICNHVHNFFTRSAHPGTYTITGGALTLDFMKDGQRFHIVGSDLNDGVYTWHVSGIKNDDDDADAELQDETFTGCIMPMAVPKVFLDLCKEIGEWVANYGAKVDSPFQSESVIGVYSYEKGSVSGSAANGGNTSPTWETVFASRLNPYRRTGDLL